MSSGLTVVLCFLPVKWATLSLLGVLGDCLSVAATQHRPKDVLDKMDELWDEGMEKRPAHWIRHAIILVLNDTLHFLAQR